ncbi:MAG TPA: T9SS type A sorting domain-containing protein [Bacteroidia bacterium]|nr:T9SS type A sorting domain-containing protein [Bacteroidia bacterium]
MKKNILYALLFFGIFCSTKTTAQVQTTLNPGDMAFIGFSTSGNWDDYISLVTFTDLYVGTVFYYSDNPYKNGTFCTSTLEHCIQFTVTGYIIAGTIISYDDGGSDCPSVGAVTLSNTTSNCGAITAICSATNTAGTNAGLNSKGDNAFIFQGGYASPSFVCAIKNGGKWKNTNTASCTDQDNTELPITLTDGVNALWIGSGSCRGLNYTCPAVTQSVAAFQASIYTGTPSTGSYTNWTCTTGSSGIQLPNAISTCSFTLATAPSCVLPVDLYEFTAQTKTNGVQLKWTTVSETNNDYFTVEKSVDGISFKELTKAKGAGNSEVTLYYSTYDKTPLNGVAYYRLKQTDFNGNYRYFKTIEVTYNSQTEEQINLYPNPVTELTKVSFNANDINTSTINVANYLGNVVYSKAVETQKGLNKIELQLMDIPSGIYFLKISGNQILNNNIVKLIRQ